MKKKVFLIVFCALFIISVIEVITIILPSIIKTINPSAYPVRTSENSLNSVINSSAGGEQTTYLNYDVLNTLRDFRGGIIKSATVRLECTGTIKELYTEPFEYEGHNYQYAIELKDYSAFMCKFFDLTQDNLETLKVYDRIGNETKEISYTELKKEDKIEYVNIIDLTKDSSQLSKIYNISITRIQ